MYGKTIKHHGSLTFASIPIHISTGKGRVVCGQNHGPRVDKEEGTALARSALMVAYAQWIARVLAAVHASGNRMKTTKSYMHIPAYLHIQVYTCTYRHTCTYIRIHTNTCTYIHIQDMPARTCTYLHIPVHTDLHPSLSGWVFEEQLRPSQAAGWGTTPPDWP